MPSGIRINWSQYDPLLRRHLPKMTITAWVTKYAPELSDKAVGVRARKLGITPARYRPTKEHKAQIAKTLSTEDDELIIKIRQMRDNYSNHEICEELNLDDTTLWRIITRNKIKLSVKGKKRAKDSSRQAHLGKTPWNQGGHTPTRTRAKISEAVSGEKNGQYGRRMTAEEADKWRKAYRQNGIHKMRAWLESEAGQASQAKKLKTLRSPEYRAAASERSCEMVRKGKIKFRGIPTRMVTKKGGKFTTKSSYETRFAKILEADPSVKRFVYEPFKIPYTYRKRKKNYIPDFLVEYVDGREELVEVKPAKLVGLPRNKAKIKAGVAHKLDFVVITEDFLDEAESNN